MTGDRLLSWFLLLPEMQGIEMLEGDVWGHRKDMDEYFTVEDSALEVIRARQSAAHPQTR